MVSCLTFLTLLIIIKTNLAYPTGEINTSAGFDLHARLWKKIISAQNEQISSGGYLTAKFQELVFRPAVDLISFEIRKISDQLESQNKMDIIEIVGLSTSGIGLVIASFYFIHKLKLLLKNTVMK